MISLERDVREGDGDAAKAEVGLSVFENGFLGDEEPEACADEPVVVAAGWLEDGLAEKPIVFLTAPTVALLAAEAFSLILAFRLRRRLFAVGAPGLVIWVRGNGEHVWSPGNL